MLPARDFFPNHAMVELWKALGVPPAAPKRHSATIKREMAGSCIVLRPVSDRQQSWPEAVHSALQARQKERTGL
jgi:hypothetical protein